MVELWWAVFNLLPYRFALLAQYICLFHIKMAGMNRTYCV